MGKSIPSPSKLRQFSRILLIRPPSKLLNPFPNTKFVPPPPEPYKPLKVLRVDSPSPLLKMAETSSEKQSRIPLAEMVADCAKLWFQDTLKEAKAGDIGMQVLVGQMYTSGYGVPRDEHKGRAWLSRASKVRNSVWKVSDKQPAFFYDKNEEGLQFFKEAKGTLFDSGSSTSSLSFGGLSSGELFSAIFLSVAVLVTNNS